MIQLLETVRRALGVALIVLGLLVFGNNLALQSLIVLGPFLLVALGLWVFVGPRKLSIVSKESEGRFQAYLNEHPKDRSLWLWARRLEWLEISLMVGWIIFGLEQLRSLSVPWLVVLGFSPFLPSVVLDTVVILHRYKAAKRRQDHQTSGSHDSPIARPRVEGQEQASTKANLELKIWNRIGAAFRVVSWLCLTIVGVVMFLVGVYLTLAWPLGWIAIPQQFWITLQLVLADLIVVLLGAAMSFFGVSRVGSEFRILIGMD